MDYPSKAATILEENGSSPGAMCCNLNLILLTILLPSNWHAGLLCYERRCGLTAFSGTSRVLPPSDTSRVSGDFRSEHGTQGVIYNTPLKSRSPILLTKAIRIKTVLHGEKTENRATTISFTYIQGILPLDLLLGNYSVYFWPRWELKVNTV